MKKTNGDGIEYWPGTTVRRSRGNAFDWRGAPSIWLTNKENWAARNSNAIAAYVESTKTDGISMPRLSRSSATEISSSKRQRTLPDLQRIPKSSPFNSPINPTDRSHRHD